MKFKKLETALACGLIFAIVFSVAAASLEKESSRLSDKLLRLHVIANSDSPGDQALKIDVRDEVLRFAQSMLGESDDIASATAKLTGSIESIENAAQEKVYELGYDYPVRAELGVSYFPTREYETFSLPPGNYSALRIIIGDGAGKNWWCVVFPPLCASATESAGQYAKRSGLSEEEAALISGSDGEYVLKFKSIELINNIRRLFDGSVNTGS